MSSPLSAHEKLVLKIEQNLVNAGKLPIRLLQLAAYFPYHIRNNGRLNAKSSCQPLVLWSLVCLLASVWSLTTFYIHIEYFKLTRTEFATDNVVQKTISVIFLIYHKHLMLFAIIRARRFAKFWSKLTSVVSSVVGDSSSDHAIFLEEIEQLRVRTRIGALVVLFVPIGSHLTNVLVLGQHSNDLWKWEQRSEMFTRIILALTSAVWVQETYLHGALALWLSYLVRVQVVCLRMISHRLARALEVSPRDQLVSILSKSVTDFEHVEGLSREFNELYDHLLLLDFCFNGILSTYFAYLVPTVVFEGNYTAVMVSLMSICIIGHRLHNLCSACSSYLMATAEVQQNLLKLRTVAPSVEPGVGEQVIVIIYIITNGNSGSYTILRTFNAYFKIFLRWTS